MTVGERSIARRWCILNMWGWPKDLPKPESPEERYEMALREMQKAMRAIGKNKCLEYWNSDEFAALSPTITPEYGRVPEEV